MFKEKALFNFVRTFLRELDVLALDLNLSLSFRPRDDDGDRHHQKPRGIARFRWSKHSIKGGGGDLPFFLSRETMMMVCKKGVLLLFEKGWWFLGSLLHTSAIRFTSRSL